MLFSFPKGSDDAVLVEGSVTWLVPVLALTLSCQRICHVDQEDVIERIAELTDGHRADVCIEVIGSKATFEQARVCCRSMI